MSATRSTPPPPQGGQTAAAAAAATIPTNTISITTHNSEDGGGDDSNYHGSLGTPGRKPLKTPVPGRQPRRCWYRIPWPACSFSSGSCVHRSVNTFASRRPRGESIGGREGGGAAAVRVCVGAPLVSGWYKSLETGARFGCRWASPELHTMALGRTGQFLKITYKRTESSVPAFARSSVLDSLGSPDAVPWYGARRVAGEGGGGGAAVPGLEVSRVGEHLVLHRHRPVPWGGTHTAYLRGQ